MESSKYVEYTLKGLAEIERVIHHHFCLMSLVCKGGMGQNLRILQFKLLINSNFKNPRNSPFFIDPCFLIFISLLVIKYEFELLNKNNYSDVDYF